MQDRFKVPLADACSESADASTSKANSWASRTWDARGGSHDHLDGRLGGELVPALHLDGAIDRGEDGVAMAGVLDRAVRPMQRPTDDGDAHPCTSPVRRRETR